MKNFQIVLGAVLAYVAVVALFWVSYPFAAVLLLVVVVLGVVAAIRRCEASRLSALETSHRQHEQMEIKLAESIQRNSLPSSFPPYPMQAHRFDIYAMSRPAKSVGGDFYDFYHVDDNRLAVVMADVSGMGIPAAMFMMKANSALKTALIKGDELKDVVTQVNEVLCDGNAEKLFVTAWIGLIDLSDGSIVYVNAGHTPPVLKHVDGLTEVILDPVPNLPLAIMSGIDFECRTMKLTPGDMLFLYTDGITESMDSKFSLFGEKRLVDIIAKQSGTAKDYCQAVVSGVDEFIAGGNHVDDLTLLAYRFKVAERIFPATMEGLRGSFTFSSQMVHGADAAVVFDELLSNIVRCSGANNFRVRVLPNKLVEISDDGEPFDPTAMPDPDVSQPLEGRKVGGLGIFLVRNLTKTFVYHRENDWNVTRIELKD